MRKMNMNTTTINKNKKENCMKNRNRRGQSAHLSQLKACMKPATAYRTIQKITLALATVVKTTLINKRKNPIMNYHITNHVKITLRQRLQGLAARFAALKSGRSQSKSLMEPFLSLLLISAMALSSLPVAAASQQKGEKVNPKTALPANQQKQASLKVVDPMNIGSPIVRYPEFKGKLNPEVVLSAEKKLYILNKFAVKGEEKGKEQGKEKKAPVPPSGRYRVSIVGFVCEQETRDDVFAWDGLSDEIRLNVATQVVDRDSEVLLQGQAQSRVMGSVNGDEWRRNRVHAGTADRFGGIRNGDAVPSRPAYAPLFDPRSGVPVNPELPFLMFEGDLVQGMNAVSMVPTIWEYDGGAGLWPSFQRALAAALPSLITAGTTLAAGPAAGAAVAPAAEATIGAIDSLMTEIRGDDGGDRLIGIQGGVFSPTVIRFNYDTAELALRTRLGGAAPAGIIPIVYRDSGNLNGNYTLYVKVERLDPVLPPG
jgi:hypothetical protein